MKVTGIVRRLDDLGRVVIPAELRKELDIQAGDKLDMVAEGRSIILTPSEERCERRQSILLQPLGL